MPTPAPLTQQSSRWICLLSFDEVLALQNYGRMPNCRDKHHKHISRHKALTMIETDLACTVGEEHGINAIVEHSSNGYVWKTRMSGGYNVRQLVRLVQG
jgi:hypothetical protein